MFWLIGGTSESRTIAEALSAAGYPWAVTVTTAPAVRLYEGLGGQVHVSRLDPLNVDEFLRQVQVRGIIDASHPFATEISVLAMATGLPYLRFERLAVPLSGDTIALPDFDAALAPAHLDGRRVLLSVGVKALPRFVAWQERAVLWARVLPASVSQAVRVGFRADRLVPMQPPIDDGCERDLWQRLQIQTVITKASGEAGGVAVKQAVARELSVQLLVVARPLVAYPLQTAALADVLAFCREHC